MLVLNKKAKIILAILVFIVLVIIGTQVEKYEKDAFVKETIATDDAAYVATGDVLVDGKININTADLKTLVVLDGIGEVLAQRIIDYRTKHGPFSTVEEIMNVPGISTKTLEKFSEKVCAE